jgi:hypothetical protein
VVAVAAAVYVPLLHPELDAVPLVQAAAEARDPAILTRVCAGTLTPVIGVVLPVVFVFSTSTA